MEFLRAYVFLTIQCYMKDYILSYKSMILQGNLQENIENI